MDIVRRNSVLVIHGSLRVNPLHPNINILINDTIIYKHFLWYQSGEYESFFGQQYYPKFS